MFQNFAFGQEIIVSGFVKDSLGRGIIRASVLVFDDAKNTIAYTYSNEKGVFELSFSKKDGKYRIVTSSLGYQKIELPLDVAENNIKITIVLEEKIESLKEVIVEAQSIRKEGDTTTFITAKFINQSEQTVEDVLRKIPGIEVQKDGSIKAHGKYIDKLLVEGDDMFDKNYKLLSKNLDANVLDAVQILDNFEDNPILKNLVNSNRVAINLKIKKNKKNIWFGNLNLGAGVISENRWKEGINLGLLRKRIKLFYFADYNNSGEKASDLMVESISDNNFFSEDRYEKNTKTLFNINSGENTSFSKSQTIFNRALLNSLSFTTKLLPNLSVRAQSFFANDNQTQDSFSQTQYNLGDTPIAFSENNSYRSAKTLASVEFEIKYFANAKNYLTNKFVYKTNPSSIFNDLNFNNAKINQSSNFNNQLMYNHFYQTLKIGKKAVLNNYFYIGNDKLLHNNQIKSPFLNNFFNAASNSILNQNFNNYLFYYGVKSKLMMKFKKLDYSLDLNFENNKESLKNNFLVGNTSKNEYENNLQLRQTIAKLDNTFRYNFTNKLNLTASLNYAFNNFDVYNKTNKIVLFNPQLSLFYKSETLGIFTMSYLKNNSIPAANLLLNNSILNNYNGFIKGALYMGPIENVQYSFSHSLLNDKKRYAFNSTISYLYSNSAIGFESNINQNFIFSNYTTISGGTNYLGNFNFINYFRNLKLSLKLDVEQSIGHKPTKVNNAEFNILKSYGSSYKFTGTSYFTGIFNFDFGVQYNFNQSTFLGRTNENIIKEANINLNYKLRKTLIAEVNSNFYQLNNTTYSFLNVILNYTPQQSRFSYRLILNNLTNQNQFTLFSLKNFTSYRSTIDLVPRYALLNIKYRF